MHYPGNMRTFASVLLMLLVYALPKSYGTGIKLEECVPADFVGQVAALDQTSSSAPPPTLHLTFALSSATALSAPEFVASLTDPTSPNFHHWLTPHTYGERFGATPADIGAVESYLAQHGFTSIKVWPDRLFMSADSTPEVASSVFSVDFHSYRRSSLAISQGYTPTFYAPDHQPSVDSAIASRLTGIFGLSNSAERKPTFYHPMESPDVSNNPLAPSDLAKLYDGGALHTAGFEGAGITIAIFSPTTYLQSDINEFLSYYNITGTNINIVKVGSGTHDNSNEVEAAIDIETVVGQAPNAKVDVYEGANDGSLDIFNAIANASPTPNIVTESYGTDENAVSQSYATSYETLREQMAAEGISIFVASGDNGAYDSTNQTTVTTSVDATSAYVTAVGGTELEPFANDVWNGEVAWTYNDGTLGSNTGSGGGLSIYYPEPTWQAGPGVDKPGISDGMRQIPDISAVASTPFYEIYAQGQFSPYGGTSCSTQFIGATFALIEEALGTSLGNIDPTLYGYGSTDSSIYHDITSGNNGLYFCTPNWDFVTGWGTPDFSKVALAFQGTNSSPTPVHTFSPGLQMFSLPYAFPSTDTAGELLNGLVFTDDSPVYDIAAFQSTSFQYAVSPTPPAAAPEPGFGYWARFGSTDPTFTAIGTPISTPAYSIALSSGWNIIGDPYTNDIPIDSLSVSSGGTTVPFETAVSAKLIQPYLYDYNGTSYVSHGTGDTMDVYDGYWIFVYQDCSLIYSNS